MVSDKAKIEQRQHFRLNRLVSLPADFCVWLASREAAFLKGRYVFANWDVDELKSKANRIESSGELRMWIAGLHQKNFLTPQVFA